MFGGVNSRNTLQEVKCGNEVLSISNYPHSTILISFDYLRKITSAFGTEQIDINNSITTSKAPSAQGKGVGLNGLFV